MKSSSVPGPSSFFIRTSKFFILLFTLATCAEREPSKPNILLVTLDTFRADRLGPSTPNLGKLAAEAVRFTNAQTPVPLTLPAHASMLSGLTPLHHGLRNNGGGAFPADQETLATVLSKGGYRTGAFVGAFVLDGQFGLDRGFDTYDDEIVRDPNSDATLEAERRGSEVVDRALAWLGGADARPVFTWVHLWDAHTPYAPPAPYPRSYDGEIAYVDAQVGRLLASIDRANTIVVVAGDHGEGLGEHDELTHGLLLYQPTLHVPMLIAAPGVRPRAVAEPVSTVDLAPTVAALANVELPPRDGRNLASILRDDAPVPAAELYAETQYPLTFGWSELSSLRRGNLKLISGPAPELYDLQRDPREATNNLTSARREYRDLTSKLEALRATAVAAAPATVDEETKRKLASLGYIAPAPVAGRGERADPKAMAPLFLQFEKALASISANDPRAALAPLQELVRRDPANPVFRSTLARVQRELGSGANAVALYREAVALTPNDADAWYNLGVALGECCDPKEALAALSEAARLDPGRGAAHNAIAILYMQAGDPARSAEAVQRAVAIDPRDARAWNTLGNALRALGRANEAAGAYRKATALAPTYADPLNGLGVLLVQQQRPREAIPYFDSAIRLQPDFYEARLNRGIALQEAGDRDAAAAQYRDLLGRLPAGPAFDAQRNAARALLAGLAKT